MPLLYSIGKVTVGKAMILGWRPRVEGLEHVPATGGAVFAGNHLSVADELFLGSVVPRHLAFWAKSEYFDGKGLKGWFNRNLLEGLGAIPVLKGGDAVALYPEGTRSPDGRLYKGKTGVARMALEAGVPVVPVAMIGTDEVHRMGSRIWRPHRVHIRIGAPLDFSRYAGMAGDRFIERSMTDEIMYTLMELSGQTYVDKYAASVKERAAAQAREAARLPDTKAG